MDREKALRQVQGLLPRVVNAAATVEEARSCAVIACKLIVEFKLLSGEELSQDELHRMASEAIERWLDLLWEHRKAKTRFVPARRALELLDPQPPPTILDKLHKIVLRKARGLRAKGILIGQTGSGGFRIAPHVRRQTGNAA